MKAPPVGACNDEEQLLKSLNLDRQQEKVLKHYLLQKRMEYLALKKEAEHVTRLETYIKALKKEMIEESQNPGSAQSGTIEMSAQISRLKAELESVVNFTRLLDLKDAPTPGEIFRYFNVKLRSESKVEKPFPGKYQGFLAGSLPHGIGILTSTTPTIARTKPASPGFSEVWNSQFYLGNPIGRVLGRDSLENSVEFIQLEGKHQGYEIAKFADGTSAHLCVDMNRSGVCVQVVPHNAVPPIKPYGHLKSGIRLVIYKKEHTATSKQGCAFGSIQLEEIEDGKVMKTWKYIQDAANHLLGSIPRHNLDILKANLRDHMAINHVRELAREEVLQREKQSKKPG